jgi:hypothetical protein
VGAAARLVKDPLPPAARGLAVGPCRGPGGSVRPVMGMGGAGGPDAERRRRLVAALVVLALVVTAAATVLSIALG